MEGPERRALIVREVSNGGEVQYERPKEVYRCRLREAEEAKMIREKANLTHFRTGQTPESWQGASDGREN